MVSFSIVSHNIGTFCQKKDFLRSLMLLYQTEAYYNRVKLILAMEIANPGS
jgi:hypothetical protein